MVAYTTPGYISASNIKAEILGANYSVIDQVRHNDHLDCALDINSSVLRQLQLSRARGIVIYDHEQKIPLNSYEAHSPYNQYIYLAMLLLVLAYSAFILIRNK